MLCLIPVQSQTVWFKFQYFNTTGVPAVSAVWNTFDTLPQEPSDRAPMKKFLLGLPGCFSWELSIFLASLWSSLVYLLIFAVTSLSSLLRRKVLAKFGSPHSFEKDSILNSHVIGRKVRYKNSRNSKAGIIHCWIFMDSELWHIAEFLCCCLEVQHFHTEWVCLFYWLSNSQNTVADKFSLVSYPLKGLCLQTFGGFRGNNDITYVHLIGYLFTVWHSKIINILGLNNVKTLSEALIP